MPETDLSTVHLLLYVCSGLLFVILIGVFMVGAKIGRLERLLAVRKEKSRPEEAAEERGEVIEGRPGGPFEKFLEENPAARQLTKKEQSTAYRKWRQAQGMNWSNQ